MVAEVDLDARVTRAPGDEGVIWATSASAGVSVFVQNAGSDYNAYGDHTGWSPP